MTRRAALASTAALCLAAITLPHLGPASRWQAPTLIRLILTASVSERTPEPEVRSLTLAVRQVRQGAATLTRDRYQTTAAGFEARFAGPGDGEEDARRILLFSRTAEYRHDSIPDAVAALTALGAEHGLSVDATEDPAIFDDPLLAPYRAVVFLLTTGNVLEPAQQAAFERFIRAGGGYAGVHSASDTEYDWPWYGQLVGAYFRRHPEIQTATIQVEDFAHPSTAGLPERWERTDEWYDFRANPRGTVQVLARLDEGSYAGGSMGADHPIAWCHAYDGGRAWYTAGGHTPESYREPLFLQHLLGGIEYAAALG
jgi:type 1 glutamine amidotransferase